MGAELPAFSNARKLPAPTALATGNKRHFRDRWKNTAVLSARELIEV